MEGQKMFYAPALETIQEIKQVICEEIRRQFKEQQQLNGEKLFYVAQVAKKLGRSHATIKKLVASGTIRSTKNGMIPESAIEEFLKGN